MLKRYYLLEGLNALGTNVFFLGVFFHARINHGFSDGANLMLAAAQGAAYVLATRTGGRLADRVGADRSIALGLAGMCLSLLGGWLLPQAAALFAAIALYSASTALTWPALEAAIARTPGRTALARRAGLYNVIWSLTGAVGFFFSGPLFALQPDTVFLGPLAAHALMLAGIAATGTTTGSSGLSGVPGTAEGWREAGDPGARQRRLTTPAIGGRFHGGSVPSGAACAAVTPAGEGSNSSGEVVNTESRARYLLAARIANGLGYFLFGAFAALAPTVGERLGLGPRQAMWLVSTYLFARSAVFLLFWRWSGWEYRRGWLVASLALPPAALAATFLAPTPAAAIAALAVLGATSGAAYSSSLHASLDREGGHGEGGGVHEWVIGIGILLGPLAGAAGAALFGGPAGAGGLVTALGAAAAVAGLAPLLEERDSQRPDHTSGGVARSGGPPAARSAASTDGGAQRQDPDARRERG